MTKQTLQRQSPSPSVASRAPSAFAPRGFGDTLSRLPAPVPQAKLTVNQPGDKYEQEADAAADRVLRMGEAAPVQREGAEADEEEAVQAKPLAGAISPLVQREGDGEEEDEEDRKPVQSKALPGAFGLLQREEDEKEEELQAQRKETGGGQSPDVSGVVSQGLSGGGQPLDDSTRSFMEPRFGHDFSQVRIHTDSRASQSSEQIAARAYTVGSDIAFRSGEFSPGSSDGRRLLAHELTHVVQQGAAAGASENVRRAPRRSTGSASISPRESGGLVHGISSAPGEELHRAVDTDGGTWDTTKYETHDGGPEVGKRIGAEIVLAFTPKAPVESDSIGLVQSVKTMKSTSPGGKVDTPSLIPGRNTTTSLTDKEGDKGRAIDQIDKETNPLYAVGGHPESKTLTDAPADAQYGEFGHRKKLPSSTFDIKAATLHDIPGRTRAFVGQGWEHSFEVTALVLEGAMANTYLGSVAWGWRTDAGGSVILDPNPIAFVRAGQPSAAFMAAADKWNATKVDQDGKEANPVKLPTNKDISTRDLLAKIESLATLLKGGADPAKEAEKKDLETELGQRSAKVDVAVTKTHGRIFDDKVYVRMSGSGGASQTGTVKMGDGASHTFQAPFSSVIPPTGIIHVEVWDHDMIGSDNFILAKDWVPPYPDGTTFTAGNGRAVYTVTLSL